MAEPAPARGADAPIIINITGGAPVPLNPSEPISGSVTFICHDKAYDIWTWDANGNLNNVFQGETNNYLPCVVGSNGPYPFNTAVVSAGQTISFQPNTTPPDAKDVATGVKGTIQITSGAQAKA